MQDFFDTSGTLFSMCTFIDNFIPGFMDRNRDFPRSIYAYCTDGLSIVVGSCMGTSPCTVFIESATGEMTLAARLVVSVVLQTLACSGPLSIYASMTISCDDKIVHHCQPLHGHFALQSLH